MHFENQAFVQAEPQELWEFLMDTLQVAECIPGVQDVRAVNPDNYTGVMKVRVGPVALHFTGKMSITERDSERWRASMRAEGTDKGVGGAARASVTMTLREMSPTSTQLTVITEADVLGKLGEFGQPIMRSRADKIMTEFAANVSKRFVAGHGPAT